MKKAIDNIENAIRDGKAKAIDINNKKERLHSYIEYLEESQLDVLQFIIDIGNKPFNKHKMVKFIQSARLECSEQTKIGQIERLDNYDTSYPINYLREIEAIYPEAVNGNYIYDYSNLSFGRLVNLNNLLVRAIIKKMK